ncbi:MAG: hypothetical protein ACKOXK_11345, partial [Chakrabartia sp.]
MVFHAQVLTLYPDMFPGPLGHSIAGRALEDGKWALSTLQIRDFATDKHRTVDDTPAGGGAGMVLKADVLARALDHAIGLCSGAGRSPRDAAERATNGPWLRPPPERNTLPILA